MDGQAALLDYPQIIKTVLSFGCNGLYFVTASWWKYSINELYVEKTDWLSGCTLAELNLKDEGVLMLGINRNDGTFIGTPNGKSQIKPADTLVLYGRGDLIERLDRRHKGVGGQLTHAAAVSEQKQLKDRENKSDVEN
jgi:hypothetical protein